jgi:hypothetical protein
VGIEEPQGETFADGGGTVEMGAARNGLSLTTKGRPSASTRCPVEVTAIGAWQISEMVTSFSRARCRVSPSHGLSRKSTIGA